MTDPLEDKEKKEVGDTVNSPDLSPTGKVRRRAITSPEQAFNIATQLERNNEARNKLNAVILSKYNGAQPHNPQTLKANLEDWRSNAPTGFMSGIVDRITPAPMQAIDSARSLTSAKLDTSPEDEKKSVFFRNEVTKAIRSWDEWRDFNSSLWQEDVLMGQAAALFLNPYSPWPKLFRGDEVFFPEGTGQHSRTVQMLSAKEDLLIHEFVEFIKDYPDIDSGWYIDNCVKTVNDSLPRKVGDTNDGERKLEDAIREGNAGASHSGAKIVQLFHTLAVEPDTKQVTHYIVNRTGNHEVLFCREDRFEKMEDVVTLFTLQPANGKYYASKGTGRMLLNPHIAIERARNEMLDNLRMAGLVILKADAATAPSMAMRVVSPFILVTSNATVEQQTIQANVEAYLKADDQVARWTEQLVGSYISGLRGSDAEDPNRTATEAQIDANRDAQAKTAFLARAWGQFADLVSCITRRLCDPETTDEIAKEFRKKLKDPERGNLSDEEIKKLSSAPAAEVLQDLTQMQNQQVVAIYPLVKGDINIDQHKLLERFLSAATSPEFARDVMLDEQGLMANELEAMRQQMGETEDILKGAPGTPVSPRDNHVVHLKTIFSDLKAGLPKVAQISQSDPSVLDHMNAQLVHSKAHIQMMRDQGAKPDEVKPFDNAQKTFESALHHIGDQLQGQMRKQQEAQGAPGNAPEALPASPATPEGSGQPEKEPPYDGQMTEKVVTAWIGQYDKLPETEKRRLEQASGLGAAPEEVPPVSTTTPQPEQIIPQ